MSLQDWLQQGRLKSHPADADEIELLLTAAERSLADAGSRAISDETRFDAAYRAITQVSLAALAAHGYRPATDRPGHHVTIIQSVAFTLGLPPAQVRVLDTLRRKRNVTDYTGEYIDDSSVGACISEARKLLTHARARLRVRKTSPRRREP